MEKIKNIKTPTRFDPYRVMLVDDSSVIRGLLSRWLGADPAIEIVASVANGRAALGMLERSDPEIVVLDIEMPIMDGLTALPQILKAKPNVQVLMSSNMTKKNAKVSMQAMSLGAADYVPKPSTNKEIITSKSFQNEMIEKIKILAAAKRKVLGFDPFKASGMNRPAVEQDVTKKPKSSKNIKTINASMVMPKIIAIGSSTGGPQALLKFINGIKGNLSLPVVITQHMPASFTKILAGHLSKATGLDCVEAVDGMLLKDRMVFIAPGDHHMVITTEDKKNYIRLNQEPPENFCRPAVDIMFRSISKEFGPAVLGVILTGMGQDGLNGSKLIVENGGTIIAQNEESSVVWGMPGAVSNAGICNAVLPLDEMGRKVQKLVKGSR